MCGITGIFYNKEKNGIEIFQSLLAIQHRGQDGAGIYWTNNDEFDIIKKSGLITQIFELNELQKMNGNMYLAHTRYKTNNIKDSYQPFIVQNNKVNISLCHNGNIINVEMLYNLLKNQYNKNVSQLSDSHLLTIYIVEYLTYELKTIENINWELIQKLSSHLHDIIKGSYSLLLIIKDFGLVAIRDKYGIRPLSYGINENNDYLISSETCSFNHTKFNYVQDVLPGETIWFNKNGTQHFKVVNSFFKPCLFEYIYFSRFDSYINHISVYKFRIMLGKLLSKYIDVKNIDCIIPTPETSRIYAYGLSQELNIPIEEAIILNRYVNRTFIGENKDDIASKIRQKFSIIGELIKDKNVLILDDSIVRGNTSKGIIELLNKENPKNIYFASAAPKIYDTNKYGIHIENKTELITYKNKTNEEIAKFIGVNKVFYSDLKDVTDIIYSLNNNIKNMEISMFFDM